jgi:hypothetical protein
MAPPKVQPALLLARPDFETMKRASTNAGVTDADCFGGYADASEAAAYVRVKAPLASGLEAWVYVDARGKPPAA